MNEKPSRTNREILISVSHPGISVDRKRLSQAVKTLDEAAERFGGGCPPGELSIAIVTDKTIAELHAAFLSDPTPTDVITFEGDCATGVAGEICVSADTAKRFAKEHGKVFSEELTLYVAHGWLHLAGYDDLKPELKRVMRRAEARALRLLGEKKLLGAFKFKKRPATKKNR